MGREILAYYTTEAGVIIAFDHVVKIETPERCAYRGTHFDVFLVNGSHGICRSKYQEFTDAYREYMRSKSCIEF